MSHIPTKLGPLALAALKTFMLGARQEGETAEDALKAMVVVTISALAKEVNIRPSAAVEDLVRVFKELERNPDFMPPSDTH
jgi:hypothetical protein